MPISTRSVTAAAVMALCATSALAGVPYPTHETPAAVDLGRSVDHGATAPITVTVALKLRDQAGAEALLQRINTKGDPAYRKWLTPAEFAAKFGPTDDAINTVRATLGNFNLKAERISTTLLHVTGAPADFERAFGVSLHDYSVGATGKAPAYTFRAPLQQEAIPAAIAPLVHSVVGLNTRPAFHPNILRPAQGQRPIKFVAPKGSTTTPDAPGQWTVVDFDIYYHAAALQKVGVIGGGHTLGIMTLASFTQSDAYTYWNAVGLTVSPTRITEIPVDGGSGAPSDASGSDETTLDVEQSGGIASGSNVLVYEAPNSAQGIVDVFGKAVSDNLADSLSISWGEWEWFDTLGNNGPVVNPTGGKKTSVLTAIHDVLLQAGLQGESTFAAAGDSGAYDVNRGLAPPDWSLVLSTDYPASDTAITAAGGTTLAGTQIYDIGGGNTVSVTVPAERAWSWDYLNPLCVALGLDIYSCGIFPVGGGGGISIESPLPSYQSGVTGIKTSLPNQVFTDQGVVPPVSYFTLPAGFAGRNVPDISFNADPQTGYVIGYTSSATGSYGYDIAGGTSFVAPQLNGVTQLMNNVAGGRLGLLNTLLYTAAASVTGKTSPINIIKDGNNAYFKARKGYSQAVGLGTLNIGNLATVVK